MTCSFRLILVGMLLCSSTQLGADKAVSISVTPAVATEHGIARVKLVIARDVRNRTLKWEVEGPAYYRSSQLELHGSDSPRAYFFTMRNLPVGPLELRASVRRDDESVATSRSSMIVLGGPSLE